MQSLVVKYAPVKFANFLHLNDARTRLTTLPHSGTTKVRLFPAVLINLHNSKVWQIEKGLSNREVLNIPFLVHDFRPR